MSKYLARCMGGKFCNHQPGECTADPEYQAQYKREHKPAMDDIETLPEAAKAWRAKALDLIERITLEWNETYRKTGTDYAQGYSDCAGVLLSELEKLA